MKPILEYIISKNSKTIKMINATDETIKKIVKDELDRLGHDADLNHIDVSEVINMDSLFSCSRLGEKYEDINPDVSKWDVSNVISMRNMFYNCVNFNCDISGWDVSSVEDMTSLFHYCEKFNKDISNWKVGNVETMKYMFFYCKKFNKNLSGWDVRNVKDARFMFDYCRINEEFKPKFK
jgi:surface protein